MPQPDPADAQDYFPDDLPAFTPGTLVRHRRYGYRGVVVDFDMRCQAPDQWYRSNQTRPDRDQPWYHVLVHGSTVTTYAAEQNLAADPSHEPIDHPLVPVFFDPPTDDGYVRNDEAWPDWG